VRGILIKRVLICIAVFAAVHYHIVERHGSHIQGWIVDLGQRAGCEVIALGRILWGPDGPFVGEGLKVAAFNFAARNGAWLIGSMAGWAAALAAYGACCGLERFRPLGYRGPSRCGRCGYELSGLKEPRCPECGLVI